MNKLTDVRTCLRLALHTAKRKENPDREMKCWKRGLWDKARGNTPFSFPLPPYCPCPIQFLEFPPRPNPFPPTNNSCNPSCERFLLYKVSQILHKTHTNMNISLFLKVSISYRANFVWDINVIRGKDCLCIFAFMQIGHEIRNLAGRYVLRKTQIHNSGLQPCPNIQSRDILCGNILF